MTLYRVLDEYHPRYPLTQFRSKGDYLLEEDKEKRLSLIHKA